MILAILNMDVLHASRFQYLKNVLNDKFSLKTNDLNFINNSCVISSHCEPVDATHDISLFSHLMKRISIFFPNPK